MATSTPPELATYLVANRAFMDPAIAQAVQALGLREGARVLDMGTGAGGAIPHLARSVGTGGHVLAIDLNPDVVPMAQAHVGQSDHSASVTIEQADAMEHLRRGGFDAIWTGDVIWPGNFADPGDTVRKMAGAVQPGGIIALFYSNYYQSMFLPGHSRLERLLRAASEKCWGLPTSGPHHYERYLRWLLDAGLSDVRLQVFPRVGFPIDADPAVRPYMEAVVWPELRHAAARCGGDVGLTPDDLARADALLTPGSPDYVMNDPGFFIMHPAVLATGRRTI